MLHRLPTTWYHRGTGRTQKIQDAEYCPLIHFMFYVEQRPATPQQQNDTTEIYREIPR